MFSKFNKGGGIYIYLYGDMEEEEGCCVVKVSLVSLLLLTNPNKHKEDAKPLNSLPSFDIGRLKSTFILCFRFG